ncbi:MAG: ABC-2 family transporter protein [Lachnospiraceae bacterium]|nr:ABC-2 family transporter protein [Lachnospiraceae bacterium]
MYFMPVQIYLGQLSLSEIIHGFLIQFFWIALLFSVGMFLWKKGQKKLVVQGG